MKLAAGTFLVVLVAAHLAGDPDQLLGMPLSMFRDTDPMWPGYLLFALLLLVGALYVRRLWRCGREPESFIAGLAGLLLLLVAATPSLDGGHLFCSALLFLLLYLYYGILLYRSRFVGLLLHLPAPIALAWVTGFHSYGLWQKTFIVYFVLAAAIHDHLLRNADPVPSVRMRRPRGAPSSKRRKVYQLDPGRAWSRHPPSKDPLTT